jgi:hypothetical protein
LEDWDTNFAAVVDGQARLVVASKEKGKITIAENVSFIITLI